MLKIATVCTGIGSPEVALRELEPDHEIVFACEIDKYARQTYLANFEPGMMLTDMTKESWVNPDVLTDDKEWPNSEKKPIDYYADIFIGGIPCQAFSLAGKRMGELDPRGLLFFDFYRYVKNQQPKVFIIENVKGLLSDAGGKTFQNWLLLLGNSVNGHHQMFNHPDSLGYNLHHTVLNSKNFGVPQNRERVFIVGIRNDLPNEFRFPAAVRLETRLKDILEPVVDEKYYLSDKALEYLFRAKEQRGRENVNISDGTGICSTITANYRKGVHNMGETYIKIPEATKQGFAIATEGDSINLSNSESATRRGRVGKGMANTLDTACNQAVVVPAPHCVAMRGRGEIGNIQQTLEPRHDGITNTITSVQKDNLIVENVPPVLNEHRGHENKEPRYIYNGIVPTLRAQSHGHETKVVISPIINSNKAGGGYSQKRRIRRLTPLECFRLQGFPDDYHKPCSDSQTYKQAGNSITKHVIKAVLKNLLPIIKQNKNAA